MGCYVLCLPNCSGILERQYTYCGAFFLELETFQTQHPRYWKPFKPTSITITTLHKTPQKRLLQVVKSGDKPHFMRFDLTWFFDLLKIGDYAEGKRTFDPI